MEILKIENSSYDNILKIKKNYVRTQGNNNEIIYTFFGVIPKKNINKTLLSQVSELKYRYFNSGFETLFIFNGISEELSSRLLLRDLSDNFDSICLNENDEFIFKL